MAIWDFSGANWPTNFSSAVRGWLPIEKTCGSFSHQYSNGTCRERLRRFQPISEESRSNV